MAFEITTDDLINVARRKGFDLTEEQACEWFEQLDLDQAEASALYGNDLDEQTDMAYDDIEQQLTDLACWEILTAAQSRRDISAGVVHVSPPPSTAKKI